MPPAIIDRGRGPEIAGTRITVYDVMDYLRAGCSDLAIAQVLRLSPEEVGLAVRYIREHEAQLIPVHDGIRTRDARGNPPEIQAQLAATREKINRLLGRSDTTTLQDECERVRPSARRQH